MIEALFDSVVLKVATHWGINKILDYYKEKQRVLNHRLPPNVAIELENISMKVEDRMLIENFNFKFKKNSVYGILGPSGSGKSILSDHFNGLTKCKDGNIYLFNGEIIPFFKNKIKNYREIRKEVGMVLQFPEYQLFKETVLADVCYGLQMLGIPAPEAESRAKEKLLELEMSEDFFNRNPFMLSGGQKRKVALSGILAIDPEIIIFDEPTIGLDPQSEETILGIIQQLKEKSKTIIIISHNVDLILSLTDEVLVLDKGKLVDFGDPYYIFRQSNLKIGKPKIIKFIEKLCKKQPKFSSIWDKKPKNSESLAAAIQQVINP